MSRHSSPVSEPSGALRLDADQDGHAITFIDHRQGVRRLSAKNAAKHRRAIFSITERQRMSDEVLGAVPDQDPRQVLLDLERFEDSTHVATEFAFFAGPFGVYKPPRYPESKSSPEVDETSQLPEDWMLDIDELIEPDRDTEICDLRNASDNILNGLEPWELLAPEVERMNLPFDSPPQPDLSSILFGDNIEAWIMLSHYKDRIVPLISPLAHGQEAPWASLVMPCAINTLGEITMNGRVGHARLALLNALLSTSAFHLSQHSAVGIEHWKSTGASYLTRAQLHFLQCMEEACALTTKKSKYKETLMAILSLSTAHMIKGDYDKRLTCLVQAERFICIKGFNQSTLSPKRRALHHCYAYMRIMAETTSLTDDLSNDLARASISTPEPASTDFRISPNIAFSDNIMAIEKDPAVAQRDLHLAIPGRWSLTLFPKIYGVAESFLMLLSQVIRLANERDLSMRQPAGEERLRLKDFWVRAKALEKGIHVLLSSCTSGGFSIFDDESQVQRDDARARAMYSALLIFFHRRIYDLDAALLRQGVDAVRDSLERIQQDEAGRGEGSTATLIWPAFIAACEAIHVEAQLFFSAWFDSCFSTTGLVSASLAKQVFEMIWAKRLETGLGGEMCSWPEILRVKRIRLMCT
ncbi:hypothetical protein N7492_008936 [Penicillium capsulatum]|uniref:Arginine metabolism regulation protein II n=1 Tax=Penicillium capsulatum TaxID=69766 RepID=A0A9W9LHF5_9EURO|nr:hypothetical protein N7492_008936 [Penicillium capsulatum]KAJ6106337.1 hypothetical protein N7512_009854 [Penicillium capsulatum]